MVLKMRKKSFIFLIITIFWASHSKATSVITGDVEHLCTPEQLSSKIVESKQKLAFVLVKFFDHILSLSNKFKLKAGQRQDLFDFLGYHLSRGEHFGTFVEDAGRHAVGRKNFYRVNPNWPDREAVIERFADWLEPYKKTSCFIFNNRCEVDLARFAEHIWNTVISDDEIFKGLVMPLIRQPLSIFTVNSWDEVPSGNPNWQIVQKGFFKARSGAENYPKNLPRGLRYFLTEAAYFDWSWSSTSKTQTKWYIHQTEPNDLGDSNLYFSLLPQELRPRSITTLPMAIPDIEKNRFPIISKIFDLMLEDYSRMSQRNWFVKTNFPAR